MVERRGSKRWSQRELARRSGLRTMRLSRLENGHVTPSLPELLRLAEALETGLADLLPEEACGERARALRDLLPPLDQLDFLDDPEERSLLARLLRIFVAGLRATRSTAPPPAGDAPPPDAEAPPLPLQETPQGGRHAGL